VRRRRRSSIPAWLLAPALLVLLGLLVLPVIEILRLSVQSTDGARFTLAQYRRFFADPLYVGVLLFTLKISLIVTVLDVLLGYPIAYLIARTGARVARALTLLVIAPLLVSLVVRTYGWMVILAPNGLVNQMLTTLGLPTVRLMYNEVGVIIGMTHILLPFMVLTVTAAIQNIDRSLEDAAATLGAGRWEVFRRVTLPLSLPGVLVGVLLVFILTLGSYVTPVLLGGDRGVVISSLVYDNSLSLANWAFAAAIAAIFLVVSIVFVMAYQRLATQSLPEDAFASAE
jgi:putative spermidine/putrescine transport system permease protein